MATSAIVEKVKTAIGLGGSYKMLLLGETGSGKTSFLNLLCNYGRVKSLSGGEKTMAKFRQFHDIELEDKEARQMQSKTSGAKIYEGDLCCIIDTPGFGDSRGLQQDEKNVKSIISCLKDETYVNCVCIVINGRLARMTSNMKYVFTEITAILPRKILDNIVVVFTNTSNLLQANFDPAELQTFFGRNISEVHCIDNPYCQFEKAKKLEASLPNEKIAESLQKSFEETAVVLDKMWSDIKGFEKVYTNKFIELYDKKQEIERSVLTMLTAYDEQKNIEQRIEKAKEIVEAALRKKKLHAKFSCKQTFIKYKVTYTKGRHNTLCGVPGCHSNCHVPCYLEKTFDQEKFKHCRCMESTDYCTKCEHHYTAHYHNQALFEEEECEEELIDEDMKQAFEAAQSDEDRASLIKRRLLEKREASVKRREKLSNKLLLKIEEFQSLGVQRNFAKLIEAQLDIIKLRLKGEVLGKKESIQLKNTVEKLEKKLEVVRGTLQKPFSPDTNPADQVEWACTMLGLNLRSLNTRAIRHSFNQLSKTEHPDKGGTNDYYQRLLKARDILVKHLS